MDREQMISALDDVETWDMIIVGGGATGLGTAIEAASLGYRTLLLEKRDFGSGTSSRSTKLVHGGVRYLRQGNIALVVEALKERGILRKNAPHLVHNVPFVVPNYAWWEGPFYGIGLKMYDVLAGRQGFGRSKLLSRERTLELLPTIEPEGLDGGVIYYDGQFDDSRLAINLAQTAAEQGASVINYMRVEGLVKADGVVRGVLVRDLEQGDEYELEGRVVINATGVFADGIRRMDDPEAAPMIRPSQGVHIVLDRSFLPGDTAIMVPKTDDGRVLFAIPWYDRILVGTTDTPVAKVSDEPVPLAAEIEFLLTHAGRYLVHNPSPSDVKSVFAGLRPLVSDDGENTASISREHTLHISPSGLVTITGGKWTTYRRMAEETVSQAATLAELDERPSVSATLQIHGYHENPQGFGTLAPYGSDAPAIRALMREDARYAETLHDSRAVTAAEVVWAVRHEMARTVEDVLSRRTRTLLLDARASMAMAPKVASLMAEELGYGTVWVEEQVATFNSLACRYVIE